jgi:polysaccharide pyruvyl transferase WcaK-like protein
MRCVLVGNYGVGNLGDELLRECFLSRFPEIEWTVLSANPSGKEEVPRLPAGVRSFFTPWYRTLGAIRHSDAVVFGGGSLFTDVESPFACFLWWWHVLLARIFGKPVALAFQGIGPFKTKPGEWFARSAIALAGHISVRDEESQIRIENLSLNRKIIQSFDPVLLLLEAQKQTEGSKNVFVIIPRKNSSDKFLERASQLVTTHSFPHVRIVSLAPDDPGEKMYCKKLQNALSTESEIRGVTSLSQLKEALGDAAFVLAQRYHGALAALAMGIEFETIAQQEGDKLASLRSVESVGEYTERALAGERALREWLESH